MSRFFAFCGGRKMANGYLAAFLLTIFALFSRAGFLEYSAAILVALGITSGLVAHEDSQRARHRAGTAAEPEVGE
jgi:hypothetical protein